MKTVKFISIALAGALLVLSACKKGDPKGADGPTGETVTDACGNAYPIVKIGNQYWLAENLRCNKYADQSEVVKEGRTSVIPTSEWMDDTPYYTDASNKDSWDDYSKTVTGVKLSNEQVAKLGYHYSWAAAVGIANGEAHTADFSGNRQGICPNGCHIPSKAEWQTLVDYIEQTSGKGDRTAGKHLKTTSGWNDDGDPQSYPQGLDTYGFAGLPAGRAMGKGVDYVGTDNIIWSATLGEETGTVHARSLSGYVSNLNVDNMPMDFALSVRCVKN
ncbi:MAG: hypothetical protein MJ003_03350 [Paludibacteraceae bacterium]|nr:hypothetical protein [Paludibacteraceae bacterium]